MVDRYLISLQDTREDLAAKWQSVRTIEMTVIMAFDIVNHLCRLVFHRGKAGMLAQGETIHFGSNDTEFVFRQSDKRKEDLLRNSQAGNEQ